MLNENQTTAFKVWAVLFIQSINIVIAIKLLINMILEEDTWEKINKETISFMFFKRMENHTPEHQLNSTYH